MLPLPGTGRLLDAFSSRGCYLEAALLLVGYHNACLYSCPGGGGLLPALPRQGSRLRILHFLCVKAIIRHPFTHAALFLLLSYVAGRGLLPALPGQGPTTGSRC